MGGGSWNSKNYGGLHTGADKNQNSGPYSSDGYRVNPTVSHLDFVEGEDVIYIGNHKYKHKTRIPNGTRGTVLSKNNLQNKRLKSCRSLLRVDFNEHGIRYVRKELLQFPSDYSESLEEQLDKPGVTEGVQSYRNEARSRRRQLARDSRYEQTLDNRQKTKEFREWRKDFLDQTCSTLQNELNELKHDENLSINRKKEVMLKQELRGIRKEESSDECSPERKAELTTQMAAIKEQLEAIKQYESDLTKEKNILNDILQNKQSRKFIRKVYNRESYNNYLHATKEGKPYVFEHKPSREYTVTPNVAAAKNDRINLLQWGLYPRDVA